MLELNLKTRAVTQTTQTFNSMCRFGDIYLGADADGLHRIGGFTDDGSAISALIESGLTDFGTDRPKRCRLFYFGIAATNQITLTVTCDGTNVATYYFAPINDSPVVVPVPVARGHKGRYWQWKVENDSGGFFALYSVRALVVVL